MKVNMSLITVLSLVSIYSCGNDQAVHAYVVVKTAAIQSDVSEWRPVMRVTYRVGKNTVLSEVASLVDEYSSCAISNKNNWECQYEDGTGVNKFGFLDGKYWEEPGWGDSIRHVSRWEYNTIRCKWYKYQNGRLKGLISCLQTYV